MTIATDTAGATVTTATTTAVLPLGDAPSPERERPSRRPSQPLSRRRDSSKNRVFALSFAALVALAGGASLAAAIVVHLGQPLVGGRLRPEFEPYVPVLLFAAAIRAALFLLGRHNRNRRCRGSADEIAEAVREASVGSLAIVVFTFFWRGADEYHAFSYSRNVFVLDWLMSMVVVTVLLLLSKRALAAVRRQGHNVRAVVVVGESPAARAFMAHVGDHPETGYQVAGHLWGGSNADRDFVADLVDLAASTHIDEVVVATNTIERAELSRLVGLSQFAQIKVRAVPELFGLPPSKISLQPVGHFPLLSLLDDPLRGTRRAVKRALDVGGAAFALVVLSPVMAVAAIAVRLTSPGPILFGQHRVGMDGRPFRMLKFRTMHAGADPARHQDYVVGLITAAGSGDLSPKNLYKVAADPRVTRIGRVLRQLSIDELPQLFNVLKGEMSLVGPRPSLPYEAAVYDDWHRRRFDVRPGMTGLWQVSGRSRLSYRDMVRLDLSYIETWSPMKDLLIILQTLPAVLRKEAS